MLRRNRLVLFFLLAFPLSWYPWILALTQGKTTGPNPLGPLVAAIIVTALTEGRGGLKAFFSRLIRFRVGLRWYALIVLAPVAICLVAMLAAGAVGAVPRLDRLGELQALPTKFLFILLFIGLGEEPGWRGFAIEHLQERFSPLTSSLILAPLWALWHLPLLGNEFPAEVIAPFVLSVFAATVVQTWLYNRTRHSVLVQMIFHATVNTVGAGLLFPMFTGGALEVLWWAYSTIWVLIACAAGFRMRGEQAITGGRSSEPALAASQD